MSRKTSSYSNKKKFTWADDESKGLGERVDGYESGSFLRGGGFGNVSDAQRHRSCGPER